MNSPRSPASYCNLWHKNGDDFERPHLGKIVPRIIQLLGKVQALVRAVGTLCVYEGHKATSNASRDLKFVVTIHFLEEITNRPKNFHQ